MEPYRKIAPRFQDVQGRQPDPNKQTTASPQVAGSARKIARGPTRLLKRLKTLFTHSASFWNTYYMLDVILDLVTEYNCDGSCLIGVDVVIASDRGEGVQKPCWVFDLRRKEQ